jgi:hypothetical protein
MGYQSVEVKTVSGIRMATVFNAELVLWADEIRPKWDIGGYETMVKEADAIETQLIDWMRVVPRKSDLRSDSAVKRFAERNFGVPASEGSSKNSIQGEVFMRFTAYRNDKRITAANGLLPGTYATTEADSHHVKSGKEAVERYALPDPKPAIFRYRVDPEKNTVYREGVAQPAYGHAGGGVEVIFDDGASDKTVSGPAVLPEE